jgi:hypothetical protein
VARRGAAVAVGLVFFGAMAAGMARVGRRLFAKALDTSD